MGAAPNRLLVLLLLVGAAPLASPSEPTDPPEAAERVPAFAAPVDAPLRLVWVDLAGVWWFAFDATTRRLARMLAPAGIQATWERLTPGSDRPCGGINVILMPRRAGGARLGATRTQSDAHASLWVYPVEIASSLGLPRSSPSAWAAFEQRELSEAMAIVIAHELAHLLAGPAHGGSHLMSSRLRASDLRDRSLAVGAGDLRVPGVILAAGPSPQEAH